MGVVAFFRISFALVVLTRDEAASTKRLGIPPKSGFLINQLIVGQTALQMATGTHPGRFGS
jgi:hypothetical protein